MTWLLEASNGKTREFDSRSAAENEQGDLEALGLSVELTRTEPASDGGEVVVAETAESDGDAAPARAAPSDVIEDPVNWIPSDFVDIIDDTPSITRKGYAVLAERYDISVTAEPVILPDATDFKYAAFRALAETPNGEQYSGFGTAHVDRADGDDPTLLAEMAETRALKRATAWATGVGMTAVSEMKTATVEGGATE